MKYSHKDEKLETLIGHTVEITMYDDTTEVGILERGNGYGWGLGYFIRYTEPKNSSGLNFMKSHIKNVEVVR